MFISCLIYKTSGTPIARQLFFKLTNNIPLLFSRSNWTPPHNLQTLVNINQSHQATNTAPCKYIIRLNINCINYDSMLYFYRLLFSKCSNYSKKDFSLFVLKTSRLENVNLANTSLITVEYQLSLKYDPNAIVQTSKNAALIYQVNDCEVFHRILRILGKYTKEIVNKKVYSIQDPDRNKIYLIDTSIRFTMPIYSIANSFGISENYFRILQIIQKTNLSASPCSSSSSSSFGYSPNSTAGDNSLNYASKNLAKLLKSKKKLKNDPKVVELPPHPPMVSHSGVRDLIQRFSVRAAMESRLQMTDKSEKIGLTRSRSGYG